MENKRCKNESRRDNVGWLVGFGYNGPLRQYFSLMVGCFGFNGPLRQYFSLYKAVSQREGQKGEKG